MGAGHAHPLHLDHRSPVHALPPQVKILATLLFTVVVVACSCPVRENRLAKEITATSGVNVTIRKPASWP